MKKITCIERKYKVEDTLVGVPYYIVAKTELSKEITDKLLHEDMELQTFLAKYDILVSQEPVLVIENEEKGNSIQTLSREERISIIENELPEIFSIRDFLDNLINKGYSKEDSITLWKSVINYMRTHNKVEVIDADNRNKVKYKYIGKKEEKNSDTVKLNNWLSLNVEEKKYKLSHEEEIIKAKEFIRDKYREGKDWSSNELGEETKIGKLRAQQIVYTLSKKERFIVRSNPEVKHKRDYRWMKAEAMVSPSEIDKEYTLRKLQEEKKVELGIH